MKHPKIYMYVALLVILLSCLIILPGMLHIDLSPKEPETVEVAPSKEWVQDGDNWRYEDKNGNFHTGWLKRGTRWYYFGEDGIMYTGWHYIDGYWYFLQRSGSAVTDKTIDIGNQKYTFNDQCQWVE